MKFSISLLYNDLAEGDTLCSVQLPQPPSFSVILDMLDVLDHHILDILPEPVDVEDTLTELGRVLAGEIVTSRLSAPCLSDRLAEPSGSRDVTIVFGRDVPDCCFYLEPDSRLEDLERFLS
jgi:hypothetical protein